MGRVSDDIENDWGIKGQSLFGTEADTRTVALGVYDGDAHAEEVRAEGVAQCSAGEYE